MSAASSHIPDRSHLPTERRHPRSHDLDLLSIPDFLDLFLDDQREVFSAIASALPDISSFIVHLTHHVRAGGRLIYLGAGTSGRLGVLDASECPPTFQSDPHQIIGIIAGGDASLRKSSEGLEDDPHGADAALTEFNLTHNDCVLGIAAGGTTPYVLGGLEFASHTGAFTALLTCAFPPVRNDFINLTMVLSTGPELLTGSTRLKAGTATKIVLNMITTCLFTQLGKVHSNLMVDVRATNLKLRDRACRIIMQICPELGRQQAIDLLQSADGEVKTAIVMHHRKLDSLPARRLLAQHAGSLRAILH
ncbi:MAG TPA: N-acetylmuramic acid 6-phosphate etherase [Phycisphaerales bacterium]|nr:N-acetylmuramic acid 6-phosphate etherase [Phycisphaerales bacterium]